MKNMEIIKVRNYKKFADMLHEKTECDINIEVINANHTHYQLNKDGISLGVLCIDEGEASFAPFVTHETAEDDQYINVQYMPMFNDLIKVLNVFYEMFVIDEEE